MIITLWCFHLWTLYWTSKKRVHVTWVTEKLRLILSVYRKNIIGHWQAGKEKRSFLKLKVSIEQKVLSDWYVPWAWDIKYIWHTPKNIQNISKTFDYMLLWQQLLIDFADFKLYCDCHVICKHRLCVFWIHGPNVIVAVLSQVLSFPWATA